MSNKVSYAFVAQDLYSKVAKKVARNTKKLQIRFKKLSRATTAAAARIQKNLSKIGKSALNLGKKIGALGVAAGALTVKFGADFQTALADLSAITGASGKDLDKLKDKTLEMAKASVSSQSEVAEAIKLVASAKPDLLENLDALTATTEQVLLLKNAAGIDLASAANITAQGLNIFGAEAKRAGEFVNILAAGAKFGSSEIAETGQAMLLAGPGAKAAGLSFLQLNAAIQATAKSGIKGSQAGTALNAIFGRLRRRGLDIKKLGLEKTFKKVKAELDKVTDATEKAQLESKIFGEEHSKVGLALIQNATLIGELEKKLKGTNTATEQAKIRMATFWTSLKRVGVLIKDVLIKVFLKLEPQLTKFVNRFAEFISTITDKDIDNFVKKFNEIKIVAGGIGVAIIESFKFISIAIDKALGLIDNFIKNSRTLLEALGLIEEKQQKIAQPIPQLPPSPSIPVEFLPPGEVPAPQFLPPGVPPVPSFIGEKLDVNAARSQTDINVNLAAPEGTINSVQSRTRGNVKGLNIGLNMVPAT